MNKAYLNIQYLDEHNVCYNRITIFFQCVFFNISINTVVISVDLCRFNQITFNIKIIALQ